MSSLAPDPYKVLNVSKDAQIAEIRSAHRKLVLKCHPDKVQDPELKAQKADEFQKVQQAYEILSDDNERQKYDEQVRLAELRRQVQSKANTSSPRSAPRYAEFEIRTPEPRSTQRRGPGMPPRSKTYTASYSRSWEDDMGHGPRIVEAEIRTSTSSRRGHSYTEKSSSRRDRDKDKDRERRKRDEEEARLREKAAEKMAKEARRQEKKQREKLRDREIKRDAEEKRRYTKTFVESPDEDSPTPAHKSDKKKSSSKKHEDKRDRERDRPGREQRERPTLVEETASPASAFSPHQKDGDDKFSFAASYIERARRGLNRSATYHPSRSVQPPVPTPPPAPSQASAYPVPEEEETVRRSSARPRRGSSETLRASREKSYRTTSGDQPDADIYVGHRTPPLSRSSTAYFESSTHQPPPPPRAGNLPRTRTMPTEPGYFRPPPGPSRAQTFSSFGDGGATAAAATAAPRGRDRSRMQAQIEEETESEEEYEERRRAERKQRASTKHRSSRDDRAAYVSRYQVNEGRTMLSDAYQRHPSELDDRSRMYSTREPGVHVLEVRPSASREASYTSSLAGVKYGRVKQSKAYGMEDVNYSDYQQQYYPRDHPVVA